MTRTYKEVEVPANKYLSLDEIKCCFCGALAVEIRGDIGVWGSRECDAAVHLSIVRTFHSYGDSIEHCKTYTSQEIWDICPRCFDERVRPGLPKESEKVRGASNEVPTMQS